MNTISLSLDEIYELANKTLLANGCDEENANILSETIMKAERDGSLSHGLFRLPAYVAGLKSKKIDGKARPEVKKISPSVIKVLGNHALAPMVLKVGIPELVKAAKETGVAILAITNSHHMAAMWPETEAIAEEGLVAFACTSYKPMVAPAGAKKALFGTNPISFAWPRPGKTPVVYDMATASMAMGEVQVAAREGHKVPIGTGLNKDGKETTDPNEIAKGGVILPFGGYKGSGIAMMVELLVAALIGEYFSFEAKENDNNDGGPPRGGEFLLALNPKHFGADDSYAHAEVFFERYLALSGTRMPGDRRYANRDAAKGGIHVLQSTIDKIYTLI